MPEVKRKRGILLTSPPPSGGELVTIESSGPIVVVVANGCGKTRLAVSFAQHQELAPMLRVSAQKSLRLPPAVSPTTVQDAAQKLQGKEVNLAASATLDDFEELLRCLVSEDWQVASAYTESARETRQYADPPESTLRKVKRIWESLFPKRELLIQSGQVQGLRRGGRQAYKGADLSDGERVAFYLVGRCLLARPGAVVVIDEPEMHLHKSIQAALWDAIEQQREDCLFVYLTHDLEFAASRRGATKVWLKEYIDGRWDWEVVPREEDGDIPEEMLLALIGSRKPILFTEGDRGSWDHTLYSRLYPGYTVVPCNNADGVIRSTASFAARRGLHALGCCGIIDRDRRTDEQVALLLEGEVHATAVSEVENLFLLEGVLRAIAKELLLDDDEVFAKAKALVLGELAKNKESLISSLASAQIERSLKENFDAKAQGKAALESAVKSLFEGIDAGRVYDEWAARIDLILTTQDYAGALKVFDRKGLYRQVGSEILRQRDYEGYLLRLVSHERGKPVLGAMRQALPPLPGC